MNPHLTDRVLDLALSRVKGILDRNRDVLVLRGVVMRFGDENVLMLRHRDANIDLEQTTLPMPRLWRDDRYVAACDPVVEFFQPFGVLFDFGSNGLRWLGILKSDIKRHLHMVTLCFEICCIRRGFPAISTLGRDKPNHIIKAVRSSSIIQPPLTRSS